MNSALYAPQCEKQPLPLNGKISIFFRFSSRLYNFKAQSTLRVSTFGNVRHVEGRTSPNEFICAQSRHILDRTPPIHPPTHTHTQTHESSQGFIYYLNIFSIRIHLLFLYSTPQGKQKCKHCKVKPSSTFTITADGHPNVVATTSTSTITGGEAATHLWLCSLIKRCAFPSAPRQQPV